MNHIRSASIGEYVTGAPEAIMCDVASRHIYVGLVRDGDHAAMSKAAKAVGKGACVIVAVGADAAVEDKQSIHGVAVGRVDAALRER